MHGLRRQGEVGLMARHDQRTTPRDWVCQPCYFDLCERCVDVLRSLYINDRLCCCKKKGHEECLRVTSAVEMLRQMSRLLTERSPPGSTEKSSMDQSFEPKLED